MSSHGDDAGPMGLSALRSGAIDRAASLLEQLAADRADLQQWMEQGVRRRGMAEVDMEVGANAVARAMEAAQRVHERLQGG